MKKAAGLAVMVVACLANALPASAQCKLPEFSPLPLSPPAMGLSMGPFMDDLLRSSDPNINPGLVNAVIGAHDAWNMTNAAGRLGDYAGRTGSDCPAGQPRQLGALDFVAAYESCPTIKAYSKAHQIDPETGVAFVDYFSNSLLSILAGVDVDCPSCGTKSVTFNLRKAFSFDPQPGQWDVWAVLAHEFGHMLGFAHMRAEPAGCDQTQPPPCSQEPGRNTMGSRVFDGETCERDLSEFDKENANNIYPPPPRLPADIVVYRPNAAAWLIRRSFDGGLTQVNWGCSGCGDKPVAVDYDGDGFSDIAVYRPTTGEWYILRSSDGGLTHTYWGCCGDIPVPGDYDGDGRADIAIYRPSTGEWYILRSSDGGLTHTYWGCCGDIPVPGDYDGDGRTDIAIYRPSSGEWYVLRSSDGGLTHTNWGCCADIPVPADYDGDRRTDIAIYRPTTGDWYVLRSSDGGFTQTNWGCCADIPVPADYDGDGRTDIAIYRPGTAEWYMLQSSGGYRNLLWNSPGQQDQPVKFLKR